MCEKTSWSDFIDVPISESGRSFPMFYLHGKAEGCAPVSTLLQIVLFYVHPGTYRSIARGYYESCMFYFSCKK